MDDATGEPEEWKFSCEDTWGGRLFFVNPRCRRFYPISGTAA
ncbi:hypothetical protein NBRC3257_2678 [Gluconobacter thailandicus NBRC 3257]|uniref:Uncharacterized protein n=1 Tax=Gluconobacter thailandicus NBRC 3257 TaxID=1381097 RepID=A0ABQ0IZN8_GLUTH|nr:hypothetical protein NBRC3255_1813 [Gluconobacter thailandicus NBRC 3255]GAD27679.1 hypothetical protein NBRC3257_2678 [Gluconobacter thailandicus NBRC 3257]